MRGSTPLKVFILLATLCSVSGFDMEGGAEQMFKKYAKLKIYSSCFGEEFVHRWKKQMMAACERCLGDGSVPIAQPMVGNLMREAMKQAEHSMFHQGPPSQSQAFAKNPVLLYIVPNALPSGLVGHPFITPYKAHVGRYPTKFSNFGHARSRVWKRSTTEQNHASPQDSHVDQTEQGIREGKGYRSVASLPMEHRESAIPLSNVYELPTVDSHVHEHSHGPGMVHSHKHSHTPIDDHGHSHNMAYNMLHRIKTKMINKVGNMTCVLKEMNLIDGENMPNYSYLRQMLNEMHISATLKEDLLQSQDFCREFSMCLPVHKINNPMIKELGYSFAFFKCMNKKKLKACFKEDFRKYHPEAELDFMDSGFGTMGRSMLRDDVETPQSIMEQITTLMDDDSADFQF